MNRKIFPTLLLCILLLSGCIQEQETNGQGNEGNAPDRQKEPCEGLTEDQCNYLDALEAMDQPACSAIQDENTYNACIIGTSSNQKAECGLLRGEAKDKCFSARAIEENSPKACDEISESSVHDHCLFEILGTSLSMEVCTSMSQPENKDKCIAMLAILEEDTALCNEISSQETKDYCVQKIEGRPE